MAVHWVVLRASGRAYVFSVLLLLLLLLLVAFTLHGAVSLSRCEAVFLTVYGTSYPLPKILIHFD
jgi:hypothetical protein